MENVYEHIDDYVNGLLEGEALEQFKAEMESNASLRKAVENYDAAKVISEGLLEVDMMETLRRLKEKRESISGTEETNGGASINGSGGTERRLTVKTNRFNIRKWIAAASFIGVMVFAGWWVMEWNLENKILAQIEWPEDLDAFRSSDTIGMTNFEKGKHYFELNDFKKSLQYLESHVSKETDDKLLSEGYEWLGAVYLKNREFTLAEAALEKSREVKAIWNLGIITEEKD